MVFSLESTYGRNFAPIKETDDSTQTTGGKRATNPKADENPCRSSVYRLPSKRVFTTLHHSRDGPVLFHTRRLEKTIQNVGA